LFSTARVDSSDTREMGVKSLRTESLYNSARASMCVRAAKFRLAKQCARPSEQ